MADSRVTPQTKRSMERTAKQRAAASERIRRLQDELTQTKVKLNLALRDTARLNYIEQNFHFLRFTKGSKVWFPYAIGDTRDWHTMRDAIDAVINDILREHTKLKGDNRESDT